MTEKSFEAARKSIKQHEGFVPGPYRDHLGNWTQGYGRLMQVSKDGYPILILSEAEANALMDVALREAFHDAAHLFEGFGTLNTVRKVVLVEMAYQLGRNGLAGFVCLRRAVILRDWAAAKREMLDSRWAEQTPSRAQELAQKMEDGDD